MRDFPVFTTRYGAASLILRQIPYRQEAYVHVQAAEPGFLAEHLQECAGFCRAVGAERVFLKGEGLEGEYPLYCRVVKMRCDAWVDPEKLRSLFPVTEQTVSRWREIHNERLRNVDNAAFLEARDEDSILKSAGAYFVHEDGVLLGIGWLEDTKLRVVAAVQPGAGERVMHTLMSLVEGASMELEVASTNRKAIRLYEKLGFIPVEEVSSWYEWR